MKPASLHESLQGTLGESFECSLTQLGAVQVRTPFLYPDGDLIDVFVEPRDSCFLVTDYGETWGQIQMQSFSDDLSQDQMRMGKKICKRRGIELERGHLVLMVGDSARIGEAVLVLGQAATELSRAWLELAPLTREPVVERSDKGRRGEGPGSGLGLDF